MASPPMSMLRCLLVVVLLAGYGGMLTPVNCHDFALCGEECGGFVVVACAPPCEYYAQLARLDFRPICSSGYVTCLRIVITITTPPAGNFFKHHVYFSKGLFTLVVVFTVGLHCVRLAFSSAMAYLSISMAMARCLLMAMLLAGHGGVLTPVNSQVLAECGKTCGGVAWRMCVDECHCVFVSGDMGKCLPHGMNDTNELPLDFENRYRRK
ncbi:hypothetical protein MTO96_048310 [Rhipicephalus appendiculatus]